MEQKQEDHVIIGFLKRNLFSITGIIGWIFMLWSMTQTLPLEARIKLSEQAILVNANEINEVKTEHNSLPTAKEMDAKFEGLQKQIDTGFGGLQIQLNDLKGQISDRR